jgi:phosphatidylglycerophosphate synthase
MARDYKIPKFKNYKFGRYGEKEDFLSHLINRKITRVMSYFVIHFTLCAEFIAFLVPLIDLFTVYVIYAGHWIWAAVLVEISLLVDGTDGETARFRATIRKRTKQQDQWGAFVDSMAGILVFPLVIFAAGYFMGSLVTGLLVSMSFLLLNASTGFAGMYFKNKQKKRKEMQKNIGRVFGGKIKGVIGFTGDVQKHVIAAALLFQTLIFLWLYFVLAMALVLIKFWVYRK